MAGAVRSEEIATFLQRLDARLAADSLSRRHGVSMEQHLVTCWRDDAPENQGAIGDCLDETLVQMLAHDPAEAYRGLGWVASILTKRPRGDEAARAAARPEEAAAARRIAATWRDCVLYGVMRMPFWECVLRGEASRWEGPLHADGLAGTQWAYRVLAHTRSWDAIPFANRAEGAEVATLRAALAGWRAAVAPDRADTSTVASLAFNAAHPDTLAFLAHLGDGRVRQLVNGGHRCGAVACAPLRIDGEPVLVQAVCTDARTGGNGGSWLDAFLSGIDVFTDRSDPVDLAELSAGEAAVPMPEVSWRDLTLDDLAPTRTCMHRQAAWRHNVTHSALVLECPRCGQSRLALCWCDELPTEHPQYVSDWIGVVDNVRETLARLDDVQRVGAQWRMRDLAPRRWATLAPDASPPTHRPSHPEAVFGRRRTRG